MDVLEEVKTQGIDGIDNRKEQKIKDLKVYIFDLNRQLQLIEMEIRNKSEDLVRLENS